jgi:hypothetical protein
MQRSDVVATREFVITLYLCSRLIADERISLGVDMRRAVVVTELLINAPPCPDPPVPSSKDVTRLITSHRDGFVGKVTACALGYESIVRIHATETCS